MTDTKDQVAETDVVEAPEYITKNDYNTSLNNALSNQKRAFKKEMEELKSFFTSQAAEKEKLKEEPAVVNPEFAMMKKQMEAATKQLESLRAEKEQEVSKRKDTELSTLLQNELSKVGVPASKVKAVMALMKHEDKVVGYDEDGVLVFRSQIGDVDLSTGIKNWSKTDEGKEFIAPTGVKGAGNKSPNQNRNGNNGIPSYSEDAVWSAIALGKDLRDL